MRMWNIKPSLLCNQHLLGEHSELHKFRHNFVKGHKIDGRLKPFVAITPLTMKNRHNELVNEMKIRGMNHKSPYEQPDLSAYDVDNINVEVDIDYNLIDLICRCDKCAERIYREYNN